MHTPLSLSESTVSCPSTVHMQSTDIFILVKHFLVLDQIREHILDESKKLCDSALQSETKDVEPKITYRAITLSYFKCYWMMNESTSLKSLSGLSI